MPASAATPNRSRWMRQGRAYGQGLMEQPLLGMHYAANLERARSQYRQERRTINQQGPAHTQVVVAAAELSHNAAGRAYTLAQLVQHLGHPVALLGSHFPQWGRELWEPIRTAVQKAQLPVHTFVAEHDPRYVEQAFELVLQHPADLVHLSKPRLPAVVVDIDDEELCNACEREPITLDGLKRRWTRLAVDLVQRLVGVTTANGPLQRALLGHGRIMGDSFRSLQWLQPAE